MNKLLLSTLTLTGLASGCADLTEAFASESDALRRAVAERTGNDLQPWQTQPVDSISDRARELLSQPLTEAAAVEVTLLESRAVKMAYEKVGMHRTDWLQAGRLRNPTVDIAALFFASGTEWDLGLVTPLLDVFFMPLRQRIAAHELEHARAMVTAEAIDLVFDARRNYQFVQGAQQVVQLQREALKVAEASSELMDGLFAAGNVTATSQTALALDLARARLDVAAAELAFHARRETLTGVMGVYGPAAGWVPEAAQAVDVTMPAAEDLQGIESRAVAASLDLRAARARIEAAADEAELSQWTGVFPDGELGFLAMRETDGEWGLGPSLTLQIPLADSGSVRRARARAEVRSELHDYYRRAVMVRMTARQLRDRMVLLAYRLRFQREEYLPALEANVEATLKNYNAMQIGVFQVFAKRREQLRGHREMLRTQRELQNARLNMDQLLAGGMPHMVNDAVQPEFMDDTESAMGDAHE